MPRTTSRRRALAVAVMSAVALAAMALPASAHVTVSADDSSKGADDSILTFRVPNEMDDAVSVKLSVRFPTSTPLAQVDPEPVPGYTITTTKVTFNPPLKTDDGTITSGVGQVTWTATSPSTGIPAGDFGAFRVLVGPLPDNRSQLAFPAIQTYSNGQSVSWTDPTTDPANPPEHPAAVLTLTSADAASFPSPGATAGSPASPAPAGAAPSVSAAPGQVVAAAPDLSGYASTSSADRATTLGIIGIVVGALGLVAGVAGLARRRRT